MRGVVGRVEVAIAVGGLLGVDPFCVVGWWWLFLAFL